MSTDSEKRCSGLGEYCGVFAIYGASEAANLAYLSLFALQHRGQESAGIVVSDGKKIRSLKGHGLVGEVASGADFSKLPGHMAIGHVRYSTTGGRKAQNIQPLVLEYSKGLFAVAHNGNLVNTRELRDECEARGSIFQTSTDSEIIVHLLARPESLALKNPLAQCLSQLKGAYSFVFLTKTAIFAARDPNGYRPLVMGKIGDATVFASETCAFDLIGAEYVRDVEPGEIIKVSEKGVQSSRIDGSEDAKRSQCIFEHIYFARPDSIVFNESVHDVRVKLGKRLARDFPVDADIVVPVPDGGRSGAMGFAEEAGIRLERGFIRNHYVGRTFIMPTTKGRGNAVNMKLNPIRSVVEGKRVVVVDDSIVRGNTSRSRVAMLRAAGAKEIHVRITAPPSKFPCYYGIDFPSTDELIAAQKSVEDIASELEVESLCYQTVEGLLDCVKCPSDFCAACFTGEYAVSVPEGISKLSLENPEDGDNH